MKYLFILTLLTCNICSAQSDSIQYREDCHKCFQKVRNSHKESVFYDSNSFNTKPWSWFYESGKHLMFNFVKADTNMYLRLNLYQDPVFGRYMNINKGQKIIFVFSDSSKYEITFNNDYVSERAAGNTRKGYNEVKLTPGLIEALKKNIISLTISNPWGGDASNYKTFEIYKMAKTNMYIHRDLICFLDRAF